jgi:phosphopantothenoylcysteine decarboxylase/phosphopantothenate--cysteine ligase
VTRRRYQPEDFAWDLGTPLAGDRAVAASSDALAGKVVAVVVCGGIAAYRTPDLCRELRRHGAEVRVYCTPAALQFVTETAIEWTALRPPIVRLGGDAAHVEQGDADLWLIAPATYGTINKLAVGIADNAATTALAAALGRLERGDCQILLAPTMHGDMVHAILRENLARLANLGVQVLPPRPRDGKALLPETADLVAAVLAAL